MTSRLSKLLGIEEQIVVARLWCSLRAIEMGKIPGRVYLKGTDAEKIERQSGGSEGQERNAKDFLERASQSACVKKFHTEEAIESVYPNANKNAVR